MNRVSFTCQSCGKTIFVQPDIFDKAYKNEKQCLSCRNKAEVNVSGRRDAQ